ncbi:MAG: hypothetical protein IT359_13210 [Gemmatimonadaceae bacterium]|nr:hypothetical protein [Gemmatimonadaceae bacterium]
MPQVPFKQLPDDARLWIFGASDATTRGALTGDASEALLRLVDDYLAGWQAHGEPLMSARDWREGRFLAIGVDQRAAGASGCSIDALYRSLEQLERALGASLLAGGRIFYRDAAGQVQCVDRATYVARVRDGVVGADTAVFDTTITNAGEYRARFERPASSSWHARLA